MSLPSLSTCTALLVICALFSFSTVLDAAYEEPWGKDADMLNKEKIKPQEKEIAGFETLVHFHQKVISEADGPRSHYFPSSSRYMLQAAKKNGLFTGFYLGCDRLMRENNSKWIYPLYKTRDGDYLKHDPIP